MLVEKAHRTLEFPWRILKAGWTPTRGQRKRLVGGKFMTDMDSRRPLEAREVFEGPGLCPRARAHSSL